jgi:hypothetical protein
MSERRILRIKGWARFQHYKHRRPPWIRLHRSLLDDPTWHGLPLASRALAPMLWLLASESELGIIDCASDVLAFRLRLASSVLAEALNPLISVGWIIESADASSVLASCKQHATSEYRDQSPDDLIQSLTDAAREPAPDVGAPARAPAALEPIRVPKAESPDARATRERLAEVTAAKRAAFMKRFQ